MLISIRIGVHFLPVDHPLIVSRKFIGPIVEYLPGGPSKANPKYARPLGPLSKPEIGALDREAGLPLTFETYGTEQPLTFDHRPQPGHHGHPLCRAGDSNQ
jgi:hypothetical protein